jgi:PiT family inorganic phosphate transporter
VDAQLVVALLLTIGFAVTNGLHDASNAIATLVATRAATPLQAILLASAFTCSAPFSSGQPSPTRSAASSPSRRT